ncbi:MAG: hypothetical protein MUF43_05250 [Flavobacterium sp.]|jgi:hypothetical protein|nr:hypothetical protein [Flavobacterium sp.]
MKNIFTLSLLVLTLGLTSCSKKIVGEWQIAKYQTSKPNEQEITLNNIGTIHFKKDNTGDKNVNYTVFGLTKRDNLPFKWLETDEYLTLISEDSDFSKSWIIIEKDRKKIHLKSTTGAEIQVLELRK